MTRPIASATSSTQPGCNLVRPRPIHRKAKTKLAKLNAKETQTQTEKVDRAMREARARIAAKKAKQDAPADSNKYGWPDGWPDQDYYIWNGQRIKRDWTRWKGK